ncbi:HECTc domain-containing protein [Naegleria gruberi]|uniref:HECT-type E3 ubiquitin transferase n=1 Tax=Naegleria gruberi TaxID=5762 RepID=D2V243_NAEGR|nr:HECTc domain-containing protein [Naegleria gruberi]EFC48988.1 HECTc domain-containing protein [Naegleria gruberi]|eukprot:XP_002681732.1 HECTc domain-containing protein [Naegleria gruberi strain NEG-M]
MSEQNSDQTFTSTGGLTLENIIQNYGNQFVRGGNLPPERMEEILQGLKDYCDPTKQFDAVSDLCNIVSISNEQALSRMGVDRFIPELLNIMANSDDRYDLMVFAARTLLNMIDIYPASCSFVSSNGGISIISSKVLVIEYIDLAEISLQIIEHLSHQYGAALLKEGVLMASLTYIDFFGVDMQKKILRIAANLSKNIGKADFELVCDILPNISRFLTASDPLMVENAIVSLTRITHPFLKESEKLSKLINSCSLIDQAIDIISNEKTSKNSLNLILKMLKSVSSNNEIAKEIYSKGLINLIPGLLLHERGLHECFLDIMYFILALLPKMPRNEELVCQLSHSNRKKLMVKMTGVKPPNDQSLPETDTVQDSQIESLLEKEPILLQTATDVLLEPLINLLSSSQNDSVNNLVLQIIGTVVYHSSATMLTETLKNIPFSTFLASLLSSDDICKVTTALQICEMLSKKLPDIFDLYFLREGVTYRIKNISGMDEKSKEELMLEKMKKNTIAAYEKAEKERKEKEENQKKQAIEKNERIKNRENQPPQEVKEGETPQEEEKYEDPEKISVAWVHPHVEYPKIPKTSRLYTERSKKASFKNNELAVYAVTKAQLFYKDYITRTKDMKMESSGFIALQAIGKQLLTCKSEEEKLLTELRDLLIIDDSATYFEIINSNIIPTLIEYLSADTHDRKSRVYRFAQIFDQSIPAGKEKSRKSKNFSQSNDLEISLSVSNANDNPTYLSEFVRKLIDVFNSVENLNVNYSESITLLTGVGSVLRKFLKYFKLSMTNDENKKVVLLQANSLCKVRDVINYLQDNYSDEKEQSTEAQTIQIPDFSYFHINERDDDDEFIGNIGNIEVETPKSDEDTSYLLEDKAVMEDDKPSKQYSIILNGEVLNPNMTLFEVFYRKGTHNHPSGLNLGDTTQNLSFKISDLTEEVKDATMSEPNELLQSKEDVLLTHIFSHTSDKDTLIKEGIDKDAIDILELLKIMNFISKLAIVLPHTGGMKRVLLSSKIFLNPKLASKIVRSIQDPYYLFGNCFPHWLKLLIEDYGFLFTFDVRQLYFDLTTKGIARAILTIQNRYFKSRDRKARLIQIGKQKIKLSRSPNILQSAYKGLINLDTDRIVEFIFENEIGTGLGPTVECYNLVSRALQQSGLTIFRDEFVGEQKEADKFDRLVETKTGLYPRLKRLVDGKLPEKDAELYYFIGTFLGRAIYDGRVLDIPFSDALLKLLRGEKLTFYDIETIDPILYQQFCKLQKMCQKVNEIKSKSLSDQETAAHLLEITFGDDGKTRLEDLCLSFTVMGTDIELVEGGSDREVTLQNLEEYLRLVTNTILHDGIIQQVEMIRNGFNSVMGHNSIASLKCFSIKELSDIFVGADEEWTEQLLVEATKCDHGYTHSSRVIKTFFKILLQMTPSEKRDFLRFVTGAPRLPSGGIMSLRPKLTIVLKKADAGKTSDMYLPSVMTCTNYLKLPEYSSETIMKEQLYKAIQEGQNAFHLS